MQYCLLICDMQRDTVAFLDAGNALAERIAVYARAAKEQYRRIYMGGCWHPPDLGGHFNVEHPNFVDTFPAHCLADTPGAAWHPVLEALKTDECVHGYYYKGQFLAPARSMFEAITLAKGYTLDARLKYFGITHVDVVGADFDGAVYATALDARALGYQVRILSDLTARFAALENKLTDVPANCERYQIGLIDADQAWTGTQDKATAVNTPAPPQGDFANVAANVNDNAF